MRHREVIRISTSTNVELAGSQAGQPFVTFIRQPLPLSRPTGTVPRNQSVARINTHFTGNVPTPSKRPSAGLTDPFLPQRRSEIAALRRAMRTECPLGNPGFVEELESRFQVRLRPLPPGPPPKKPVQAHDAPAARSRPSEIQHGGT